MLRKTHTPNLGLFEVLESRLLLSSDGLFAARTLPPAPTEVDLVPLADESPGHQAHPSLQKTQRPWDSQLKTHTTESRSNFETIDAASTAPLESTAGLVPAANLDTSASSDSSTSSSLPERLSAAGRLDPPVSGNAPVRVINVADDSLVPVAAKDQLIAQTREDHVESDVLQKTNLSGVTVRTNVSLNSDQSSAASLDQASATTLLRKQSIPPQAVVTTKLSSVNVKEAVLTTVSQVRQDVGDLLDPDGQELDEVVGRGAVTGQTDQVDSTEVEARVEQHAADLETSGLLPQQGHEEFGSPFQAHSAGAVHVAADSARPAAEAVPNSQQVEPAAVRTSQGMVADPEELLSGQDLSLPMIAQGGLESNLSSQEASGNQPTSSAETTTVAEGAVMMVALGNPLARFTYVAEATDRCDVQSLPGNPRSQSSRRRRRRDFHSRSTNQSYVDPDTMGQLPRKDHVEAVFASMWGTGNWTSWVGTGSVLAGTISMLAAARVRALKPSAKEHRLVAPTYTGPTQLRCG